MKKEIGHRWNFFKAGGAYQAAINTADDIKNLGKLDKKLWSALACPTSGLMFDSKLLSMLDADADGRLATATSFPPPNGRAPRSPTFQDFSKSPTPSNFRK